MTDYTKARYYATLDGCATYPGDPDHEAWTISRDPRETGWTTDSGCSGYGLKKAEADYLVACANENTLLKQKLEIAIKALDEISDGYLRGEREMEAHASVALMDIKDLGDK